MVLNWWLRIFPTCRKPGHSLVAISVLMRGSPQCWVHPVSSCLPCGHSINWFISLGLLAQDGVNWCPQYSVLLIVEPLLCREYSPMSPKERHKDLHKVCRLLYTPLPKNFMSSVFQCFPTLLNNLPSHSPLPEVSVGWHLKPHLISLELNEQVSYVASSSAYWEAFPAPLSTRNVPDWCCNDNCPFKKNQCQRNYANAFVTPNLSYFLIWPSWL